jgi:hypothetical protein
MKLHRPPRPDSPQPEVAPRPKTPPKPQPQSKPQPKSLSKSQPTPQSKSQPEPQPEPQAQPKPQAVARPGPRVAPVPRPTAELAGRHLVYAPEIDGKADPGEVVWTWVAYEDQPEQGKDRPVLVVGRQGTELLGLMLSSQDKRNGQQHWLSLGAGTWDNQGRPSWVRLDRVLAVPEDGIRREGAILDRQRFEQIAAALRSDYNWR